MMQCCEIAKTCVDLSKVSDNYNFILGYYTVVNRKIMSRLVDGIELLSLLFANNYDILDVVLIIDFYFLFLSMIRSLERTRATSAHFLIVYYRLQSS